MAKAIKEKESAVIPSTSDHLNPMFRLSPQHNGGSTLYDSYELRAVTDQLNRAMQNFNSTSPAFMSYLKSPFYSHRLKRMYKENNGKTQKKLMFSDCSNRCNRETTSKIGGLMSRLWKKVKHGLTRHKQRNKS